RRRHVVSRRDCGYESGAAGQDPAGGPGAGDRARGRHRHDSRRRPADRGDQPRPQGSHQTGAVSGGPVLPAGRRPDPSAAARGAPHRARADADQRADRCGGGDSRDPSQYADAEDEGVRPVTPPLPPVRVEKALALLPDVEALGPLRALLVSISRPDERALWSSSGPYLTLGKRGVQPEELRRRMPQAFHVITEHLQTLYRAYVEALECQQRGDGAGAVAALVRAGRGEERVGRLSQARAWYDVALRVSQALQDRRPEVESLRSLGELFLRLGQYAEGARHFQRAVAIAEAEFDQPGAIAACEGLGDAALAQSQWTGAQAWYARGLRLATAGGDQRQIGRLERDLGVLARHQGDSTVAGEHLRKARECFESVDAAEEMAGLLNTQGQLEAQLGRPQAASGAYREALAWLQRAPRDAGLEVSIRLNLAE